MKGQEGHFDAAKTTGGSAKNPPSSGLAKPINTSRDPQPQWLMGGNPRAIERQEAEGQTSFVESDTLPIDFGMFDKGEGKTALEKAGVKFLGPVEGDALFNYVRLPSGWKKEATTDHSMWSHLLDDRGRKRASIFYKAAFYDRRAHVSVNSRFAILNDYDQPDGVLLTFVDDQGQRAYSTDVVSVNRDDYKEQASFRDLQEKECEAWLAEHYPDWRNPGAYWD